MTPQTVSALEVANELSRYVQSQGASLDSDHVGALVDCLATARSETPADALASVAWVHGFLLEALRLMPDDETGQPSFEKSLVITSVALAMQAIRALEKTTGLAAEGFYGDHRTRN